MTLYDALKASKGLPVSDSYAALWGKSAAESGIKTLTGRLPLFFKTSDTKLRDWVIYGNNDVGKNVIQLGESQDRNNVTLTIDSQAGTVTMNGDTTALKAGFSFTLFETSSLVGDYIFSGGANGGSSTKYDLYLYNLTDRVIIGRLYSSSDAITVTIERDKRYGVYVQCRKAQVYNNVVFKPMLRKAGSSAAFEPYQIGVGKKTENGYVLNIGVGFAPISEYDPAEALHARKTINLGESPLTEGQTLSMSEFGDIETQPYVDMFIAAFEGFNYDDQLSYNQPEMLIKFKEYKE